MFKDHKLIKYLLLGLALFVFFCSIFYSWVPEFAISIYKRNFEIYQNNKCLCHNSNCKYYNASTSNNSSEEKIHERTGSIGDTFGGTIGPVAAILAAVITGLAFLVQYQANEQQRNQMSQQALEDTFFRLLDTFQKIVSDIDIRDHEDVSKIKASGHESFRNIYLELQNILGKQKKSEAIMSAYNEIQNHFKHDLHHYFRFLYHILKFVKNSQITEEQKFKYTSILRATLSAYELILIYYNGMHDYGKTHFKPLIEEFSFLKNIDDSLIFNKTEDEANESYHPLAFASSEERKTLLPDWKKKHPVRFDS